MASVLTDTLKSQKLSINSKPVLAFIFALQAILSMGWIATYPYSGYIMLVLWVSALALLRVSLLKYLIYGLVVSIVILFYMFPRSYGSGNTAWHLSLLVFSQLIFLDRSLIAEIFSLFVK